jgi:hypothetical protein
MSRVSRWFNILVVLGLLLSLPNIMGYAQGIYSDG